MKKFMKLNEVITKDRETTEKIFDTYSSSINDVIYRLMSYNSTFDDLQLLHMYFSKIFITVFSKMNADKTMTKDELAEFGDIMNGIIAHTMYVYEDTGQLHAAFKHLLLECLNLLYNKNSKFSILSFRCKNLPIDGLHVVSIEPVITNDDKITYDEALSTAAEFVDIFYLNTSVYRVIPIIVVSDMWVKDIEEITFYVAEDDIQTLPLCNNIFNDIAKYRMLPRVSMLSEDMILKNYDGDIAVLEEELEESNSSIDDTVDSGCVKYEDAEENIATLLNNFSSIFAKTLNNKMVTHSKPNYDYNILHSINTENNQEYVFQIINNMNDNIDDTGDDTAVDIAIINGNDITDRNITTKDLVNSIHIIPSNIWTFDSCDYSTSSNVVDFRNYIDEMLEITNRIGNEIDYDLLKKIVNGYRHDTSFSRIHVDNDASKIRFSLNGYRFIFTLNNTRDKIELVNINEKK